MKTRIISGTVLVAVLVGLLFAATKWSPIIYIACAVLSAIGVYEALYATGIVKNKIITAVGSVFSALCILRPLIVSLVPDRYILSPNISGLSTVIPLIALTIFGSAANLTVIFALVQFALYLKFHKDIKLEGMLGMIVLPIIISYAFLCFVSHINRDTSLFYVVLLFCWSAAADTGAYFVGVAIGKHKMSPVISPKKSWEGLIGGIASSLLVTFGVCMLYQNCFDVKVNTLAVLIATPIFVLIGVLGDLTASLIKRKCEIKDFGKLIPGHGGVLDRFDSILMISAALSVLVSTFPLIK
ncbi:MAG: hypothetical protein E7551_06705 [Ruminococcaceae bacterium]|nr:hypothetical protein [Oscillospiraceae bacterium]